MLYCFVTVGAFDLEEGGSITVEMRTLRGDRTSSRTRGHEVVSVKELYMLDIRTYSFSQRTIHG